MIRRAFSAVEEVVLCVLLAAMVVITFVTVITRYVFGLPVSYIDQLVPNLFVWVTFLGASAATKRRAHLALSLLYDTAPAPARKAISILVLAGTLALFGITAWYGAKVVQLQVENRLTTSLGYPAWLVGLAVPVGSVLLMVRAVEAWWHHGHGATSPSPSPPIV
jgi:TRAP-type C4-dicarboxylate transport system permease small subunit